MLRMIYFLVMLFTCATAFADTSRVTVRGQLKVGTLDSGVEGLSRDCAFLTNSDIARIVFTTCKYDDECEITGVIDQDGNLLSVEKIRRIDIDKEPSSTIIKEAACWASGVDKAVGQGKFRLESLQVDSLFMNKADKQPSWTLKYKIFLQDAKTSAQTSMTGKVTIKRRNKNWYSYM